MNPTTSAQPVPIMKTEIAQLTPARFGSISHGTLRTEDLLSAFTSELEWQVGRNGDFLSRPENFPMRDRLANLIGEAQDAWAPDGETLADEGTAAELVDELADALQEFTPTYGYFGSHPGDGSDFGFWVDVESVKEQVGFVSSKSQEYPDAGFVGEWLHVSDHGNATLYVRDASGKDAEIWSIV